MKIKSSGWVDTLINNNKYESHIFSNYLEQEGVSIQAVFSKCIENCKKGKWKTKETNAPEMVACRDCGFLLFQQLAYQYRASLSTEAFFSKLVL